GSILARQQRAHGPAMLTFAGPVFPRQLGRPPQSREAMVDQPPDETRRLWEPRSGRPPPPQQVGKVPRTQPRPHLSVDRDTPPDAEPSMQLQRDRHILLRPECPLGHIETKPLELHTRMVHDRRRVDGIIGQPIDLAPEEALVDHRPPLTGESHQMPQAHLANSRSARRATSARLSSS